MATHLALTPPPPHLCAAFAADLATLPANFETTLVAALALAAFVPRPDVRILSTASGSVLVSYEVTFAALPPAQQFEQLLLCCVTDVFLAYPSLSELYPRLVSLKLSSRAVLRAPPPSPPVRHTTTSPLFM
jgi:hypothetical protein